MQNGIRGPANKESLPSPKFVPESSNRDIHVSATTHARLALDPDMTMILSLSSLQILHTQAPAGPETKKRRLLVSSHMHSQFSHPVTPEAVPGVNFLYWLPSTIPPVSRSRCRPLEVFGLSPRTDLTAGLSQIAPQRRFLIDGAIKHSIFVKSIRHQCVPSTLSCTAADNIW